MDGGEIACDFIFLESNGLFMARSPGEILSGAYNGWFYDRPHNDQESGGVSERICAMPAFSS